MAAACSYWPARSSSNPWPIACAWAGRPAAERASATPASGAIRLRLRRIESAEILEDQPALLGRQPLQLLPGRIPEAWSGACRARSQDVGEMHAVARRGAADPLLFLVGLVVRERAPGIEQPVVQALLALDGLRIETARLELAGELLGLLGERAGG